MNCFGSSIFIPTLRLRTPFLMKIISSMISPSLTKISSFFANIGFIDVTIFTKKSEFSIYLKNLKFLIIGLYISMIKLFWIDKGKESNTYLTLCLYFDLL